MPITWNMTLWKNTQKNISEIGTGILRVPYLQISLNLVKFWCFYMDFLGKYLGKITIYLLKLSNRKLFFKMLIARYKIQMQKDKIQKAEEKDSSKKRNALIKKHYTIFPSDNPSIIRRKITSFTRYASSRPQIISEVKDWQALKNNVKYGVSNSRWHLLYSALFITPVTYFSFKSRKRRPFPITKTTIFFYSLGFTIGLLLLQTLMDLTMRDLYRDDELTSLINANKHIFKSPLTSWKIIENTQGKLGDKDLTVFMGEDRSRFPK